MTASEVGTVCFAGSDGDAPWVGSGFAPATAGGEDAVTATPAAAGLGPRGQGFSKSRIIRISVLAGRFDLFQHLADSVHHTQKGSGDLWIQDELTVAQTGEEILADVRHLLQFIEAQKAAGTFDGVNGTKHACQRVPILRIFLQANQIPVQPVQVLVTLDQKILDDVAVAHGCRSFPASGIPVGVQATCRCVTCSEACLAWASEVPISYDEVPLL